MYSAVYPYGLQQSNGRNSNSGNGNAQGDTSSFLYQHQGVSNSMEEAGRHYILDQVPDLLDHIPSVTQLGTMWLRDIQNRAMLKRDELDEINSRPLPGLGAESAKALVGGVVQGVSRFFA